MKSREVSNPTIKEHYGVHISTVPVYELQIAAHLDLRELQQALVKQEAPEIPFLDTRTYPVSSGA